MKYFLLAVLLFFSACQYLPDNGNTNFDLQTVSSEGYSYEVLKKMLYDKEKHMIQNGDLQLVAYKIAGHKTILGAYKIKVGIRNRALVTNLKNFKIKINLYDRQKNIIDTLLLTVYKVCEPQQQIDYSLKIKTPPENLSSVDGKIIHYEEAGIFDNLNTQPNVTIHNIEKLIEIIR